MSEERVFPPDENDWKEIKELFHEKFFEDMPFYRMRTYVHDKNESEALMTIDFFASGVILKCHAINVSDKIDKYCYLLLSDGRWVKSLVDTDFETAVVPEIRSGENFIRLTVAIQTKNGPCRRILRKKLENKK